MQLVLVHLTYGLFALANFELGPPPAHRFFLDHGDRLLQVWAVGVFLAEVVVGHVRHVGVPSLDKEVALEEALTDGPRSRRHGHRNEF